MSFHYYKSTISFHYYTSNALFHYHKNNALFHYYKSNALFISLLHKQCILPRACLPGMTHQHPVDDYLQHKARAIYL